MTFQFSQKSLDKLKGINNDLIAIVERALELSKVDFVVVEGRRTIERQKKLVASGASKTMNSRHISGHAVDLAPYIDGEVRWDWPPFYDIAKAMKAAAKELNIPIEWGGDWRQFKDGPHFQLTWNDYPI